MRQEPKMMDRVSHCRREAALWIRQKYSQWSLPLAFVRKSAYALFLTSCLGALPALGQTPSTTGLKLWLAADTAVTLDGSGGVSAWGDQSGNGNNAAQTASGNRPTVTANALNGKPVLHFSGSGPQFLSLPNLLNGATAAEALVVVRASTASGNNAGLWYFGTSGGNWYPLANGLMYDSFGSNAQQAEGAPSADITQFHVYDAASQTGLWQNWLDGVPFFKNTSNTVAFTSAPLLGQSAGYGFVGDIAEILVYDHVLSDGDRQAASTYLAQRYASIAAPSAPTLVTAAKTSATQAIVSWTNSALANTTTDYTVERQDGGAGSYTAVATIANGTTLLDSGLTPGVAYSYRVYAQNWGGTSAYSTAMSLTDPGVGAVSFPSSGIRLWLTADSALQSPLSLWQDISGNSNDGWQSTFGNRPTVVLNALNGKPVVHFNGSATQYFSLPNLLSGASAAEAFVVVRATAASGNNGGLWSFGTITGNWYPLANGLMYDSFGSNAQQAEGSPPLDITQFHIFEVSSQAGLWQSWLDGTPFYRNPTNTVAFTTAPLLGQNAGYGFFGDMAEVIVYNRALSDSERYSISAYLNQKYAITAAPATPTGLTVTPVSSTTNMLSWNAPNVAGWVQYLISRATSSGGPYTQIATVSGVAGYLDTTATAGQLYYYQVVGQNTGGASAASAAVSVTTLPSGTSVPVSGMALWLIGDGTWETPLSGWHDYSGNGNDAVQLTPANRPTVVSNAINGHSVIRFSGSSQFLTLPNLLSGATAGDIFVVTRTQSPVPTSGIALMQFGSNPNTYGAVYPWTDGKIYDDFGSSAQQVVGNVAVSLAQTHIYNVTAQAGSLVARINGLKQYSNSTNTVSFAAAPKLGTRLLGDLFYKGDIAEVMVYNRALTDDERIAVEYYLGHKYALGSAPAVPANFLATALSPNQVSLMWNEAQGNDSIQYAIERKAGSGAYSPLVTVDNCASYIDTTALGGTSYTYRVYAVNYAGPSSYSTESSVTTPAMGWNMPLTGIQLWLKADAGVNTTVSCWQDQSGLGNDVIQHTAANQPTLVTNAINGRPVVHFNGSGQYLSVPNVMNGLTSGEIFVVTQAQSAVPSTGSVLMQFGNNPYTYGAVYPWTDGKIYDDFGSSAQQVVGVSSVVTQPHIYNVSAQAGSWVARINAIEQYRNNTNTVSFTTTPLLGTRLLHDYTFAGNVAEVIVYNHVLSTADRGRVESYLDRKYLIPAMDVNGDGLTNAQELALGLNPFVNDSNGDGLWDSISLAIGINPTAPNTLYPNPNGPPAPNPPASAPGTMVVTLTSPAGVTLAP